MYTIFEWEYFPSCHRLFNQKQMSTQKYCCHTIIENASNDIRTILERWKQVPEVRTYFLGTRTVVFRNDTKQSMCGGISFVSGTEIARHSFHKRFPSLISRFTETFIVVHPQRFQKTLIVMDAWLSSAEMLSIAVADLGFPKGGHFQRWGRKPISLAIISRQLYEIEKKLDCAGCAFLAPPTHQLNPLLFPSIAHLRFQKKDIYYSITRFILACKGNSHNSKTETV